MSNTIVQVKCDSDTQLFWKKKGGSSWTQLTPTQQGAPIIDTTGSGVVTYEFQKDGSSQHAVLYKLSSGDTPQDLPTRGGPTLDVASNSRTLVYFSKNDSSPNWYVGYVSVSPDE